MTHQRLVDIQRIRPDQRQPQVKTGLKDCHGAGSRILPQNNKNKRIIPPPPPPPLAEPPRFNNHASSTWLVHDASTRSVMMDNDSSRQQDHGTTMKDASDTTTTSTATTTTTDSCRLDDNESSFINLPRTKRYSLESSLVAVSPTLQRVSTNDGSTSHPLHHNNTNDTGAKNKYKNKDILITQMRDVSHQAHNVVTTRRATAPRFQIRKATAEEIMAFSNSFQGSHQGSNSTLDHGSLQDTDLIGAIPRTIRHHNTNHGTRQSNTTETKCVTATPNHDINHLSDNSTVPPPSTRPLRQTRKMMHPTTDSTGDLSIHETRRVTLKGRVLPPPPPPPTYSPKSSLSSSSSCFKDTV